MLSPNSTTATKLLPLVPYHFLVPLCGVAANDASDPQRDEVKPTGMLGPASLNGCTMSPVTRWKRLMSPHGVFHLPKSAASLSDAAASESSRCCGVAFVSMNSYTGTPALRASAVTRVHKSSPQNVASDCGTESTLHR